MVNFSLRFRSLLPVLCMTALFACGLTLAGPGAVAQGPFADQPLLLERNMDALRARATRLPRSEEDQAIVDGWPLYRTPRGQEAFNTAMAAVLATDQGAPPAGDRFRGCEGLRCRMSLPAIDRDGWWPAGRIWVSPTQYVMVVHSPRPNGSNARRRSASGLRYFVFHEFHNSSRNTDTYDTISSHSGAVFVPFYMTKERTDSRGRRFVVIVQVAPYDVVSIHATVFGSAGPGVEVAKNASEPLQPLQALAGILVASAVKSAAPQLRAVHHRGTEGLPMLEAYQGHVAALVGPAGAINVKLPFVPLQQTRLASARGDIGEVLWRPGQSAPAPTQLASASASASAIFSAPVPRPAVRPAAPVPTLVSAPALATPPVREPAPLPAPTLVAAPRLVEIELSPLARYLRANLTAMLRTEPYAWTLPAEVDAIAEETPEAGVVYLMDAGQSVLGRIEPYRRDGAAVPGQYVYISARRTFRPAIPFAIDLATSVRQRQANLTGPLRPATAIP